MVVGSGIVITLPYYAARNRHSTISSGTPLFVDDIGIQLLSSIAGWLNMYTLYTRRKNGERIHERLNSQNIV